MTPQEFIEFCDRCEEVTISDGVASFYRYCATRNEYHLDMNYYAHTDKQVLARVKKHLERWQECETDEERIELINDLFLLDTGDGGDYDTVEYNTDYYTYTEEYWKSEFSRTTWVEIYPYRGGFYSGTILMDSLEVEEWRLEESGEPAGAAADSYVAVPDSVLAYLKEELDKEC